MAARVEARHPDTGATASFTQVAFERAWSKVGWVRTDQTADADETTDTPSRAFTPTTTDDDTTSRTTTQES